MKEKIFKNCILCSNHKVIPDPDPDDWFCDDDMAVVCKITPNDKINEASKWLSDRQEFKIITSACRPYNIEKESATPRWCPLEK